MKTTKNQSFKKYLITFFFSTLVLGLPFICNYIFALRAHELDPYEKIISLQKVTHGIFGSTLNSNDFRYKLLLAEQNQPKIIALGSSRVMPFRQESFSKSFVNCGGVFSSLDEGQDFLNELLKVAHPQIILMGVDYWWLNKNYSYTRLEYSLRPIETLLSMQKLTAPIEYLFQGKISFDLYRSVLFYGSYTNDVTTYQNIGIQALKNSSGWRPDGSYLNTSAGFKGPNYFSNYNAEAKTILDGQNERANLGFGNFIDEDRFERLRNLFLRIEQSGAKLVLILPPISPLYISKLNEKVKLGFSQSSFIRDLVDRLKSLGLEFYDFSDSRILSSNECEYFDGWHGGELTQLRILRQIIKTNPNSGLSEFLKTAEIDTVIKTQSGAALVNFDPETVLFKRPQICPSQEDPSK